MRLTCGPVGWDGGAVTIQNIGTGTTEWKWEGQPSLVNALKFASDDSWSKEPFYILDRWGKWVLYDNKRILALPQNSHGDEDGLDDDERCDYRAKTITFSSEMGRLGTFMFEGIPSF
ncbi:hypothetical protein BO71DRAFT_479212 [Aspergillus ellipticus CBS 707.79]|uniref:Uncharacterized protein n=1 Tax=Aspergillus ellipticus CBS 707.79 TaxID=1448320 RepID=A0A319DZZ8_9EURO|nr:hypothetical protein BO71DRAFT_479212 [Aspergillus ellipticus CBS 707.79]